MFCKQGFGSECFGRGVLQGSGALGSLGGLGFRGFRGFRGF